MAGLDLAGDNRVGHAQDFMTALSGISGVGVYEGLVVAEQSTPNNTVQVASGYAQVTSSVYLSSAGTASLTIGNMDGSNPRIDVVSINSSGTLAVTAGTPSATPVPPPLPASSIRLAYVYVYSGSGAPTVGETDTGSGGYIVEARILIPRTMKVLYSGTNASYTLSANSARTVMVLGYVTGSRVQTTEGYGTYYVTALGTSSATSTIGAYAHDYNTTWYGSATAVIVKDSALAGGTCSATTGGVGVTHQYLIVLGW